MSKRREAKPEVPLEKPSPPLKPTEFRAPPCFMCGSVQTSVTHTQVIDDYSAKRYCKCSRCGETFSKVGPRRAAPTDE